MSTPSASAGVSPTRLAAALVFFTATLASIYAAAGAPTPLYHLYQEMWSISPALITFIFAVYAFSLLAALLVAGSLSDHIGRRPVVFAAILVQVVAMILFLVASSPAWLIAARLMQGLATGIAASSMGAAIVDADGRNGPMINSLAPMIGMGGGSLISGALVTFGPEPTHLIYAVLLVVNLIQAVVLWRMPETVTPKPGALASLDPRVTIPAQARRTFLLVSPFSISLWMLGGFFLSLIPSVLARVTGIDSPFLGGLVAGSLMLSGAVAVLTLKSRRTAFLMTIGSACVVFGTACVVTGVASGTLAPLAIGTLITGFGMGASFSGCVRTLLPLAGEHERAELLAVYYAECYLSMSLPAIAAGFLAGSLGLAAAAEILGGLALTLNLGGYLLMRANGVVSARGLQPAE